MAKKGSSCDNSHVVFPLLLPLNICKITAEELQPL